MNLGAFAGGLAGGYQADQRMQLQRRQLDNDAEFNDRRMQLMETDAKDKSDDRSRASHLRTQLGDHWKNTYGPKQVEDGFDTQTNEDGSTAQVPKYKTTQLVRGQDMIADLNHDIVASSIKYAESGDLETLQKSAEYSQKIRETAVGRGITDVLAGKAGAMEAFAKEQGFDPASAKLVADPVKGTYILQTNTGPRDLSLMVKLLGGEEAYKRLAAVRNEAQGNEEFTTTQNLKVSETGRNNSSAKVLEAEAKAAPGKAGLVDAQTGNLKANSGLAGIRGEVLKTNAATQEGWRRSQELKGIISPMAAGNPNSMDGKGIDPDKFGTLHGMATDAMSMNPKLSPSEAATVANNNWKQGLASTSDMLAGAGKMTPSERKQAYGTSDVEKIKSLLVNKALIKMGKSSGKYELPSSTPPAPSINNGNLLNSAND